MAEHFHDDHQEGGGGGERRGFRSFAGIEAYFLLAEKGAHVIQFLPLLLLLASSLMHLINSSPDDVRATDILRAHYATGDHT